MMHRVSTAFLMRKPRKKSSEAVRLRIKRYQFTIPLCHSERSRGISDCFRSERSRDVSTAVDMTEDYLHHSSTQSLTVLYQSRLFCGLSTQWLSSGKYNIFDGTFSTCRVVKRSNPCETSIR